VYTWKSRDHYFRCLSSQESIQIYKENIHIIQPNSAYASYFRPLGHNPFHIVESANLKRKSLMHASRRNFSGLTTPRPAEFSVLIFVEPRQGCDNSLRQLLWSSETCTAMEEGCLDYDLYKNYEEKNQPNYVIYAVFRTEQDFCQHGSQGYSLVGTRAMELCNEGFPKVQKFIHTNFATWWLKYNTELFMGFG